MTLTMASGSALTNCTNSILLSIDSMTLRRVRNSVKTRVLGSTSFTNRCFILKSVRGPFGFKFRSGRSLKVLDILRRKIQGAREPRMCVRNERTRLICTAANLLLRNTSVESKWTSTIKYYTELFLKAINLKTFFAFTDSFDKSYIM